MTQIYIKQNVHKHRTQNFRRISPIGITPVKKIIFKKTHKARASWYRGPFRQFINTRFKKKQKNKGVDRSNKKKKIHKCITANTSAIWQPAAHTTDQPTSPSCLTGAI